jgi:hypothetical protein
VSVGRASPASSPGHGRPGRVLRPVLRCRTCQHERPANHDGSRTQSGRLLTRVGAFMLAVKGHFRARADVTGAGCHCQGRRTGDCHRWAQGRWLNIRLWGDKMHEPQAAERASVDFTDADSDRCLTAPGRFVMSAQSALTFGRRRTLGDIVIGSSVAAPRRLWSGRRLGHDLEHDSHSSFHE